jgi:hypothetical protein
MLWKTPREPGRAAEVAFVVGVCHRPASKEPGYSLTTMGLSGRDNHQGQQSGMPEWHRFLSCLAICALLIRSIVPELAMAAREAMARQAVATGTHQDYGSHRPKEPERTPSHDRHNLCPFCFVQAIQVLPSASAGVVTPSPVFSFHRLVIRSSTLVVVQQFLTCRYPRAPPHDVRT